KTAIRHLLWLIVELGTLVVFRVVTVHELHGLGRIERLRLPAEIDRIAVGLEVELRDVVLGADHDLVELVRQRSPRSLCAGAPRVSSRPGQSTTGQKERARRLPGIA